MSAAVWSTEATSSRAVGGPSATVTAGDAATRAMPVGRCVDAAGVVTVEPKSAGALAHVSFFASLSGSPVVHLTPMSKAAASCGLYVVPGSTSFTVHAAEDPGNTVTFGYSAQGVLD